MHNIEKHENRKGSLNKVKGPTGDKACFSE